MVFGTGAFLAHTGKYVGDSTIVGDMWTSVIMQMPREYFSVMIHECLSCGHMPFREEYICLHWFLMAASMVLISIENILLFTIFKCKVLG